MSRHLFCVVSLVAALWSAPIRSDAFAADPPPSGSGTAPAGQASGSLVDDLTEENALLWQQAQRTFQDLEAQAREAVVNEQFEEARKQSQEAQYVVDRARRFAPSSNEYEAWRDRARGLLVFVEDEARLSAEKKSRKRQDDLIRAEEERRHKTEEAKQQKIQLLKNQAEELQKERKYDEAIQILKQVLALDPNDEQAAWRKTTLEDFAANSSQRQNYQTRKLEEQDLVGRNDEAAIPWHQDILYPKNWREISAIRKGASDEGESEQTIQVRRKLDDTVPDIKFSEKSFEEVIEYLRDFTGLNIVVNWPVLEAIAVEKEADVSLTMKDVSVKKVIEQVLEQVGGGEAELGYDVDEGVITISSKEDLARRTLLRVYNVEDLLINVPDFLPQLAVNFQNIGQGGGGGGGGGGFGGGGGGGGGAQQLFGGGGGPGGGGAGGLAEEGRDTVNVDALIELIQQTIDPETWRAGGGNIGSIRALRNQLIVTQTSTAHQQLRDLLRQLREAHSIQIAVEARFITVTRNYLEQIGVDIDVVLNNGNAGFDRAGTLSQPLRDPATGTLVLVPREFSRLGFTPGAPGNLGLNLPTQAFPQPFGQPGLVPATGDIAPHSGRWTPIPIQNNTLDLANTVATNIPGTLGGAENMPALNIFGSFLDNIQVDFLLRATQVDARSSDLDAPRVVLFNGQRAVFEAAILQDYIASLQPVLGDNVGLFLPIIQQAATGRVLDVDATVSADRRYVTMTIRTQTAVAGDPEPFQFTTGSLTGGAGFVQLVRTTINQVRTTVTVPDGGTLLIGGLKQAAERERDAGVPIPSRIPVLKRAFSNTSLVKDDRVLLILIKPKILIQEEAEEEAFPTLSRRDG